MSPRPGIAQKRGLEFAIFVIAYELCRHVRVDLCFFSFLRCSFFAKGESWHLELGETSWKLRRSGRKSRVLEGGVVREHRDWDKLVMYKVDGFVLTNAFP